MQNIPQSGAPQPTIELPSAEALLATSSYAKFEEIGATTTGKITEPPETTQQLDFDTQEPLFWKSGQPRVALVVTLDTEDSDEPVKLFAKGEMLKAIKSAVREAKATALLPGGSLWVQYSGDGEPTRRGYTPPKLYKAAYDPPKTQATQQQAVPDHYEYPPGAHEQTDVNVGSDAQFAAANEILTERLGAATVPPMEKPPF